MYNRISFDFHKFLLGRDTRGDSDSRQGLQVGYAPGDTGAALLFRVVNPLPAPLL